MKNFNIKNKDKQYMDFKETTPNIFTRLIYFFKKYINTIYFIYANITQKPYIEKRYFKIFQV